MALRLNMNCLSRLKDLTEQVLSRLQVDHNVYLATDAWHLLFPCEQALPEGNLKRKLENVVAESPLCVFLLDTIIRDLHENYEFDSASIGRPLQTFASYENLSHASERLIDAFESLPWCFMVSLELPASIGKHLRNLVSPIDSEKHLSLLSPDEAYDVTYPLAHKTPLLDKRLFGGSTLLDLNRDRARHWNVETSYLRVLSQGFIGNLFDTTPLQNAINELKSFFGLALALRFLRYKDIPIDRFLAPNTRLVVHRKRQQKWEIWHTPEVSRDLAEAITKLEIQDFSGKVSQEKAAVWLRERLAEIFFATENPGQAERILSAAQWLFDSYVGANKLLSFVQSTVAMEILLGEEAKQDIMGIGELLRNRCAYLIARGRQERTRILKDFDRIYEVLPRSFTAVKID